MPAARAPELALRLPPPERRTRCATHELRAQLLARGHTEKDDGSLRWIASYLADLKRRGAECGCKRAFFRARSIAKVRADRMSELIDMDIEEGDGD